MSKESVHHGVPRAFLGSNDESTNLTLVPDAVHNPFHAIAGYRPPDSFKRTVLLSSINWTDTGGRMLPAGLYRDLLPLLAPDDWRTLYQEQAIRFINKRRKDYLKAALHIQLHLGEEQRLVSDAICALGFDRWLDIRTRKFTCDALEFFQEEDPIKMMHTYLTDQNRRGERMWTKPLVSDVFDSLKKTLKGATLETMTQKNRRSLLGVLCDHKNRLARRSKTWYPVFAHCMPAIAEHGQNRMQERGVDTMK